MTTTFKKRAFLLSVLGIVILTFGIYISPLKDSIFHLLRSDLLQNSSFPKESGLYLGKEIIKNGNKVIGLGIGATLESTQLKSTDGSIPVTIHVGTENELYNSLSGTIQYDPSRIRIGSGKIQPAIGINSDQGITSVLLSSSNTETGIIHFSFDKATGNFSANEIVATIPFYPVQEGDNFPISLEELRLMTNPPSSTAKKYVGRYLKKDTTADSTLIHKSLLLLPTAGQQTNQNTILVQQGNAVETENSFNNSPFTPNSLPTTLTPPASPSLPANTPVATSTPQSGSNGTVNTTSGTGTSTTTRVQTETVQEQKSSAPIDQQPTNNNTSSTPDSTCVPSNPFNDINDHWAKTYIEQARLACIIGGKQPGIFSPNAPITRAELTKIVLLTFKKKISDLKQERPFMDIDLTAWYASFIQSGKENGVINGYSDGSFKPNNNINRAEALKIIFKGGNKDTANERTNMFIDTSATAWYAPYISYAKNHNIISGYMNNGIAYFKPGQSISRAEAVKIIMEFYNKQ